jgi:hypothetical protein
MLPYQIKPPPAADEVAKTQGAANAAGHGAQTKDN